MSRRLKILLTEGSSTSSRQALYCLAGHKVDILDPSPFCQSRFSRLVRRWHRCPSYTADPLAYLRFVVRMLRREKYDVLLPTHEQLYLLSRARDRLLELTGLVVPDFDSLDHVMNKAKFSQLLDELDIGQPKTEVVSSRADLMDRATAESMPLYLKPAFGTAGRGVFLIRNQAELQDAAQFYDNAGLFDGRHQVLVQQPGVGDQEDLGGMFQHGRLIGGGGAKARMQGVGGAPMGRKNLYDEHLVDEVRRIGERLNWHGPISFGVFHNRETGRAEYIDANPRIGETVMPMLCGSNPCETMVQMSLGHRVESAPRPEIHVRTHQGFLILLSKVLSGEGRLSLLREIWRQWRRGGFYAGSEDELTRPREDWMSLVPAAAVTALLLALPRAANWLVNRTVANYSLSSDAADRIYQLTDAELESCFR